MPEKPPYVTSVGTLNRALDALKQAATPPRFTQDFLNNKLGLKGGTANLMIPFLKKIGFLRSDGTPTETYSRFRNDAQSGRAMADALRIGYKSLYEVNERVHQLKDDDLKGLIVQVTGGAKNDSVTKMIYACFKALAARANFEAVADLPAVAAPETPKGDEPMRTLPPAAPNGIGMNLAYTINLNLPATTDIAVFNAIFQSLRRNLLRDE